MRSLVNHDFFTNQRVSMIGPQIKIISAPHRHHGQLPERVTASVQPPTAPNRLPQCFSLGPALGAAAFTSFRNSSWVFRGDKNNSPIWRIVHLQDGKGIVAWCSTRSVDFDWEWLSAQLGAEESNIQ